MKYSPDLLNTVDHCQYRSFITNRYNGARIAVDCGQCDWSSDVCSSDLKMSIRK